VSRPFLQHYLPFLLVRADIVLSRRWMADLAESGHSVAEWRILATLADAHDVTIGELAELVLLPQPTVSRWVDRLEVRGLVQRADGHADRRRTHVAITPAGQRVAAEMTSVAERRLAESLAAVSEADVAELQRIVHGIIDGFAGQP
jgi:DNA-binding MarR family transcriptional regulator